MEVTSPRANTTLLQALVADRLLSSDQSDSALNFARMHSLHVEEAILQSGMLDEATLLRFLAGYYKTQFVSTDKLARASISSGLLTLLPQRVAEQFNVFPVRYDSRDETLTILTVEPSDLEALKNVQFATRLKHVRALVARPAAIEAAIKVHYENEMHAFGNIRSAIPGGRESAMDLSMLQEYAEEDAQEPQPEGSGLGSFFTAGSGTLGVLPPSPPEMEGSAPELAALSMPSPGAGDVDLSPPAVPKGMSSPDPAGQGGERVLSRLGSVAGYSLMPPAQMSVQDFIETVNVLVALLENDRGDLRNHSVTVARICRRFCERLGLSPMDTDSVVIAAYLHDIGKPATHHLTALNAAQYAPFRQQAQKFYLTPVRFFESVHLPGDVVPILSQLYERVDGQGFPNRLHGKDIMVGARILAIAETFADLTGHANNPFRRQLSAQEAWDALAQYRGKTFDGNLLDVFKLVILGDDLRAKLLSDGRRALIVDPDAEETTVLELRLAERGFDVKIARTADRAMTALEEEFDVVITEVTLKPFDGFALMERARTMGRNTPFVFLSRKAESEMVQRAFNAGAEEFIAKPASPDVVALKVTRVLDAAGRKRKHVGVSGSLSEMGLPELVQILFHGRKTGCLNIHSGGRRGEILFSEGQIFEAKFGATQNEEAVYEMLALTSGEFELDPNVRPTERKIAASPESMLLEGLRRMDESER